MTTVWLDVIHGDALAINVASEQAYKLHLEHNCDLYIVPCDRREMAGVALTLFSKNQVFAQFHAGDIGQGNHDEVYGWIITRCATLHLCNSPESVHNIIKSGEEPWRVIEVGSTAFDNIEPAFSKCPAVPFDLLLIHPDTFSMEETHRDCLRALALLKTKQGQPCVVIGPNKDANWEVVDMNMNNYNHDSPFFYYYPEGVSRPEFLGLLKMCERFITNSSSAILELPAYGIGKYVSIGKRNAERKPLKHIEPGGSQRIAKIIKSLDLSPEGRMNLLRKKFTY